MYNLKVVTTSWDDGDPRDLRIAELLRSREMAGTFYVPITGYLGGNTLAGVDLRALSSEAFEIGAHSVSHQTLSDLNRAEQVREVRDCKQTLEQILGSRVSMFCYPNGRYNEDVIRELQNAGFHGARTTRMLSVATYFPVFEMPTTIQAYPHSRAQYIRNLGRAHSVSGLINYVTRLRQFESWIDLGRQLFNQVLEYGGIWHLYGHSWEIDDLAIWSQLQQMLDYVSHRTGVIYATNGQLLTLLNP